MSNTFDLGGGSNAFAFNSVGDSVTGRITSIEEQQQTDMETGQPAVWDNGQPKTMIRIELATDQRDPADPSDDGRRNVYLRGSRNPESRSSHAAVMEAARRATGSTTIAAGATLTLTYAADGVPSRRSWNPPKQYTAEYAPPTVQLDPAQQDSPAPTPQASPTPAPAAQPSPEALTAGRATYQQHWSLGGQRRRRDAGKIRANSAAAIPVYVEHQCGDSTPEKAPSRKSDDYVSPFQLPPNAPPPF